MNTQKQIFLIVVLFFMMVAGCAAYSFIEPIRAERQAGYFEAESIRRGALLYANNCRTCHGITGQGGVGFALNTDAFKVQDPLVLAANQDLMRTTLYCGRAGTRMPPWLNSNGGSLTRTQIEHIIRFLTSPVTNIDENGAPESVPNRGWEEAVEFAHNLNHEATAIVTGDTLDSIAARHGIGAPELAAHLGLGTGDLLADGTELSLPAPLAGRAYAVDTERGMTVAQAAAAVHLGAAIIAELNGLEYRVNENFGLVLLDGGNEVTGLLPGATLRLPPGAVYMVSGGDTLEGIAASHGITVGQIAVAAGENRLPGDPAVPLEFRFWLAIPDGFEFFAAVPTTIADIAALHAVGTVPGAALTDMTDDQLAEAHGVDPTNAVAAGTLVTLPPGTYRLVQPGDTIAAMEALYGDAAAIAAASGLAGFDPAAPLPLAVVLTLPDVQAYVVQGQSLADVAATLSGVSAASLAQANGFAGPDAAVRVGESLAYPEDAWGSAPPDTLTSPSVCIEHTLPDSIYETLPGVGTPQAPFEPERPAEVSADVSITAGANEWYLAADGVEAEANRGVALIAPGTAVPFVGEVGLHTITINGEKDNGDLSQGDTRTITFDEPGEYLITCDYHPDMLAALFVGGQ